MSYVRSFAEDMHARACSVTLNTTPNACLGALINRVTGRQLTHTTRACNAVHTVTISRIILRQDGHSAGGRYFGNERGLAVFEVDVSWGDDVHGDGVHETVKHYSRKDLRDDLRRIFPNAKIGR